MACPSAGPAGSAWLDLGVCASSPGRLAPSGAGRALGGGPVPRAPDQHRGIAGNRAGHAACRLATVRMKSATGSHTGTGTWLLQRATAVVLALGLPGLAMYFLAALPGA